MSTFYQAMINYNSQKLDVLLFLCLKLPIYQPTGVIPIFFARSIRKA